MRHQRKGFKLGRTKAHRDATLASLATALIKHKAIRTTLTKAKALRMYVEPLITRSKSDTTHNRRQVFRHLQNKYAVTELFDEIAGQVGDRPGGYTRIIKLGQRAGDAAEMALIELVDYNDVKPEGSSGGRKKTRRSRSRRGGGKAAATAPAAVATAPDVVEEVADDDAVTDAEDVETQITDIADDDAVTDADDIETQITDVDDEEKEA